METCHPTIPAELRPQGDVKSQPLCLPAGAVRAFDPAEARMLRSIVGLIWVTQEGNAADTILSAGQRLVAAPRGKIVVQALSDALMCVS